MKITGGKKAAGAWLREKLLDRLFSAGMLAMGVSGFAVGFMVRGFFVFDRQGGDIALWGMLALVVLVLGCYSASNIDPCGLNEINKLVC